QVTSWLKKIYVDEPIPEFEVNSETINVLYDLAEYSEFSDKDTSLLIEDMKERAAKYEAEATYLQGLLTGLGLPPGSLSSEGTSYLDVIVNSAIALETKDTSLVSFFSAINDMTLELYETEFKNRQMEEELGKLMPKITGVLMLEKQLDEDLKMSENLLEERKARSHMRSKSLEFLRAKSEDMKVRIRTAENELVDRGLDQSLTHKSLVELSE
ncbi:HAUS1 protein, partial [Eurystomus gularis]|nr:HAUS1 protein [Eurystomus gularis]